MAYIRTIPEEQAGDLLRELYDEDVEKLGYVPNYTKVMSLRPQAIQAWRFLLGTIRSEMRLREYELVTIAASTTLHCTY